MERDATLGKAVELGAAADALGALAAFVRIETEDVPADPRVRALLGEIACELLGGNATDTGPGAGAVVGLARTFLRQAAELIENPGRRGGWDQVDVPLLQSIGRLSMSVADAVTAAAARQPELDDRLTGPGSVLLDVGSGTGWLSIALARAYPELRVVGLDIFEPALDLARGNVNAEGLDGRIEFRRQDVVELDADGEFDVVWLPLPFLRPDTVGAALARAYAALRPGGRLVTGAFAGPPGRLPELLTELRTVRSGGRAWPSDELVAAITAAGFAGAAEVDRTWTAPVRLHLAHRAG